MSKIKIGINGFGRIGRITFRAILKRSDVEVVAINDLLEIKHLAYLLKYDSVHGKLEDKIEATESALIVNGNSIRITSERDPSNINWGELDIDVVRTTLIDANLVSIHPDQLPTAATKKLSQNSLSDVIALPKDK